MRWGHVAAAGHAVAAATALEPRSQSCQRFREIPSDSLIFVARPFGSLELNFLFFLSIIPGLPPSGNLTKEEVDRQFPHSARLPEVDEVMKAKSFGARFENDD